LMIVYNNVAIKHSSELLSNHLLCLLNALCSENCVYAKLANVFLVYELGLELFRDTIVRFTIYPIQNQLLDVLLNQILLERKNKIIDRSNIKASIDILLELTDTSAKDSTSAEYYRVEGQMLVGEYDAPEYIKKVEKCLNEEE
ncbi:13030_t:CDS:2, partial [Dentiscutata erythropus]